LDVITGLPRVEGDTDVSNMVNGPVTIAAEENTVVNIMGDQYDVAPVGQSYDYFMKSASHHIQDFLSRPIIIAEIATSTGAETHGSFNPWNLYLNNASVRAKLKNFAFLRATLMVEINYTGSPFVTGRTMFAPFQLPSTNAELQRWLTFPAVDTYNRSNFYCYLSQQYGSKTIDIKANRPLRIKMPFISPSYCLRLFNNSSSALTAATNYADVTDLGIIVYGTLNIPMTSSNFGFDPYFTATAWVEDVEL